LDLGQEIFFVAFGGFKSPHEDSDQLLQLPRVEDDSELTHAVGGSLPYTWVSLLKQLNQDFH